MRWISRTSIVVALLATSSCGGSDNEDPGTYCCALDTHCPKCANDVANGRSRGCPMDWAKVVAKGDETVCKTLIDADPWCYMGNTRVEPVDSVADCSR
jgi:hypothetical protein